MDKSNWKKYIFHFQGGHRVAMKVPPEMLVEGLRRESEWIYTFDDDGNPEEVVALQHVLFIEVEEETDDDHASHCASCAEMDDDDPEFDPAYAYSDLQGDVWRYEEEEWWCYQQNYRTFRSAEAPPHEFGPYTRIEKEEPTDPEFDPAYAYSDRHGDVWHYEEEEWWCYQNHYRTFRANGTPPAEYGPYTRIEKGDDEPEFDPDYIYRDIEGDKWECLDGRWFIGDNHAERVAGTRKRFGIGTPPDRWGPYTRIEKEDE